MESSSTRLSHHSAFAVLYMTPILGCWLMVSQPNSKVSAFIRTQVHLAMLCLMQSGFTGLGFLRRWAVMLSVRVITLSHLNSMIFAINSAFMFLMRPLTSGPATGPIITLKTTGAKQNSDIIYILTSGMKPIFAPCYDAIAIIQV